VKMVVDTSSVELKIAAGVLWNLLNNPSNKAAIENDWGVEKGSSDQRLAASRALGHLDPSPTIKATVTMNGGLRATRVYLGGVQR
jgi:hypothetical protein